MFLVLGSIVLIIRNIRTSFILVLVPKVDTEPTGNVTFAALGPCRAAAENVLSGSHGVQGERGGGVALPVQGRFGHSCADCLPFLLLRCLCGHGWHQPHFCL